MLDLRRGLDHQVAVGELLDVERHTDPGDGGVRLLLGDLAAGHALADRVRDAGLSGVGEFLLGLQDQDVASGLGTHLGDAGTHSAATDHTN